MQAHPQPRSGPACENEFEVASAATDQYGHVPLSSFPYPQLPCMSRGSSKAQEPPLLLWRTPTMHDVLAAMHSMYKGVPLTSRVPQLGSYGFFPSFGPP
jgi:hypothetical protein